MNQLSKELWINNQLFLFRIEREEIEERKGKRVSCAEMVSLNIRFNKGVSECQIRKMTTNQTNEEIVEEIIEDYLWNLYPTSL